MTSIVTNLKKPLSQLKWNSTLTGLAISAVGIVGALRFFKLGTSIRSDSNDDSSKKEPLVPGLRNLGETCYFNVVLQALASCSYFQSFLKDFLEEVESSVLSGGDTEKFQLAVSVNSLFEELCVIGEERVLNPREVLAAMAHYVPNFKLTNQQDAEEAFLHLLSSLREEISNCYAPKPISLAVAFASYGHRILTPPLEITNEQERWQHHYLGPFDGVLASSLTCQSCSNKISVNLQFFHSLPLSPVVEASSLIVQCMLEDCLKMFFVAEQVENYNCSNCWHVAAIKYLSLKRAEEVEIERLRSCREQDSCTCHNIPELADLPWSNRFSRIVKQLHIARCPKILCVHLLRVSTDEFGRRFKLQGHINFPPVLDLHPFTLMDNQRQGERHHPYHVDVQSEEVRAFGEVVSSESYFYRLVSVVEHLGEAGHGHYRVYRSMRSATNTSPHDEPVVHSQRQWFLISDSEVSSVSEEEVLRADASLLFYEKEEAQTNLLSSLLNLT